MSPCAEEQNSAHLVTSLYRIYWMVLSVREVNRQVVMETMVLHEKMVLWTLQKTLVLGFLKIFPNASLSQSKLMCSPHEEK